MAQFVFIQDLITYNLVLLLNDKSKSLNFLLIRNFNMSDALNDLQIKISGDLEQSSSWEIDLLPMRFQLSGKKISLDIYIKVTENCHIK